MFLPFFYSFYPWSCCIVSPSFCLPLSSCTKLPSLSHFLNPPSSFHFISTVHPYSILFVSFSSSHSSSCSIHFLLLILLSNLHFHLLHQLNFILFVLFLLLVILSTQTLKDWVTACLQCYPIISKLAACKPSSATLRSATSFSLFLSTILLLGLFCSRSYFSPPSSLLYDYCCVE